MIFLSNIDCPSILVTGNATFSSSITQGSVISSMLKANGSGTLVAAVEGTDYVAPSGSYYIGTTLNTLNRASAAQTLTGVSIDGNAATATNSTQWNGYPIDVSVAYTTPDSYVMGWKAGTGARLYTAAAIQTFLGLGSNAYTSTAFLPLSGGTLTGALAGTTSSFNSSTIGSASNATTLLTMSVGYSSSNTQRGAIVWDDGSGVTGKIHSSYNGSNSTKLHFGGLYNGSYNQGDLMVLDGITNSVTLYGALSGTSLSMSGGMTIANDITWTNNTGFGLVGQDGTRFLSYTTSGTVIGSAGSPRTTIQGNGGRTLIATTTDNGTDALQVAGSGLFTGALKVNNTITAEQSSTSSAIVATSGWGGGSNNTIITYGRTALAVAGAIGYDNQNTGLYIGTTTNHRFAIRTNNNDAITIASTGAITASSSVSIGGTLGVTGVSTLTGRVFSIEIGVSKDGTNTATDGPWYRWTNAAETRQMLTQLNASNGLTTWAFDGTSWASIYTLSSTGAITASSSVTALSLIKSGGTSTQALIADGSVLGISNSAGANTLVQRDASGYIQNNYFYTSSGGAERNASGLGYFAGFNSSDYYIRSYTPTAARIAMGLATTDNVTFNQVTATLIGISSGVTVNYNNDSASTYQMLWGSGNYVYGTAGIYCNPSTDTIYANGNIIAYASSDSRYKDNQQLITNPIGKLLALRGMTFTWNNLQQDFKGNDYGLIYQDVAAVMPEITQMRENGYGAIKYEKVIPLLVEVGKNHEERIKELESKLQAYENKFGKLN